MYSSKPIHKNKHDTSYITIGDPYDRIPSKSEKNPRYHGKQFSTVFPKKGNIPSKVCFGDMKLGPQGKFLAEPLYIQSQPLDKRHLDLEVTTLAVAMSSRIHVQDNSGKL